MKVSENKHFTFRIKWKDIKNSKDALSFTKQMLEFRKYSLMREVIDSLHTETDGTVEITIDDPNLEDGKTNYPWAKILFNHLKKCEKVESVRLLVNNEDSEGMAINLCETVCKPFYEGYRGQGKYTLVYHA